MAYKQPYKQMPIDEVDSRNRVIGRISRQDVLASGRNFRTVHVFVFNAKGDLLLQKLSRGRERHPSKWGSSVAAYPFAGETGEEAAQRRVKQELGLSLDVGLPVLHLEMQDGSSIKFVELYQVFADGPFQIDRGHISSVDFLSVAEVEQEVARSPQSFTPTFRLLFSRYFGQTP